MLRKRSTFASVIAPVFILLLVTRANALPLQYLPDVSGYIPVYIRFGDQPLEEINLDLAEAFHESTGTLNKIQELPSDDHSFGKSLKTLPGKNYNLKNSEEQNIYYKANDFPFTINQLIFSKTLQGKKTSSQTSKSEEPKFIRMKISKILPLKKISVKKLTEEIKHKV